ncbi:reverse transcriptase domain-containing protein, partial [Tanacetum coccineum]
MIATTITTPITTTTKTTTTITTVTRITTNRIEGEKPPGLMLPPMEEKGHYAQINAQKQTTGPQKSTFRDKLASVHFRISTLETTPEVRIMKISQENGQSQTNTNTRMKRVHKSRGARRHHVLSLARIDKRNDTLASYKHTREEKFALKPLEKRHKYSDTRIATLAIRCMRTRNSNFPNNSNITIPRRQNKGCVPNIVEPELRTINAPMAERTMEELLRAPTEVVSKRITSTLRFRNVPNDVIKLMMFPYSLEGAAKTWYEKEPPNSILTWEDLVTKFVNQFFPPSKTTHLKNKISRFTQKFDESFSEAWERFKEMLRACPHHGFTELTQVDTFYNGLNDNDQDSLNAAAGGNLLSKTTREALNIIENKSKVRYSRNKPNASRMNTTSRENVSKTDERIDKLADQLSTLVEIVSKKVVTPAPVKAVEETCVTCGGAHSWYNCLTTDKNQASVCATTGTYNQVNPLNRVSNQMAPPGFAPVQNNGQNRFNQNQGQGNNFNQGNNFHGNQASTSGTLSSNTIPNLKGEMKAIATRSGVAYEGPSIPTNLSPKKVVEQETKETTDKEQTNFQESTAQIPPLVTPIFIPEPDVPKNLRFDISFADALLLMPRFAPTIKSLLMNKEKLLELAKIPLNENCSAMLLKKLPEKL